MTRPDPTRSINLTYEWSLLPRPSSKTQSTSRSRRTSLNRLSMNTMRRAVHVLHVRLRNPPLISLPPKAKISQMSIPLTILIIEPHLSLGWILLVGGGFPFRWLRGSRKGTTRNVVKGVKCVPEMVRFWSSHLFLRRGCHRLLNHSISHRDDRLRLGDFNKIGSG